MLGLIGLIIMAIIIVMLLKNITIPAIAFITVPTVFAFIAGFSAKEVGTFVKAGVMGTAEMAALFIFSVTFFGLMGDTGMFDRIIGKLASKAGKNVILVCLLTTLIAIIGHMDGSGASTFLIAIPAMLPIFKQLKMRKTSLMLITTSAMGVMNVVPWGGPTMRAASVIGEDPAMLWRMMMPMQGVGLICAFAVSFIVGKIEVKRGAGYDTTYIPEVSEGSTSEEQREALARPRLFWFNVVLTLAVICTLTFVTSLKPFYVFMIGIAIALLVHYPGAKNQSKRIGAHANGAIVMASTILAAGVLLGILEESGIMDGMATAFMSVIPNALGPHLAIVIGIFSTPFALVFCTDAYYYGVMPIVLSVSSAFGCSNYHDSLP